MLHRDSSSGDEHLQLNITTLLRAPCILLLLSLSIITISLPVSIPLASLGMSDEIVPTHVTCLFS